VRQKKTSNKLNESRSMAGYRRMDKKINEDILEELNICNFNEKVDSYRKKWQTMYRGWKLQEYLN
jgi:hypothetical protein